MSIFSKSKESSTFRTLLFVRNDDAGANAPVNQEDTNVGLGPYLCFFFFRKKNPASYIHSPQGHLPNSHLIQLASFFTSGLRNS